jgi:hypothetical protein
MARGSAHEPLGTEPEVFRREAMHAVSVLSLRVEPTLHASLDFAGE